MLKNLRMSANMTQLHMAQALNVCRSTVAMWESGKAMPRSDLLPKIAELLGCTIDELFENERK